MTQNSMKKRITKKQIDAAKKELDRMATETPDELTNKKAVAQLLPDIEKAQSKGHSLAEINTMLKKHGIDIAVSTLTAYLRDAKLEVCPSKTNSTPTPEIDNTQTESPHETDQDVDCSLTKSHIVFKPIDEAEDPFPEFASADETPLINLLDQHERDFDFDIFNNHRDGDTQDKKG